MTIQIEKDVPAPRPFAATARYPIDEMEVGDSFLAPDASQSTVASAICQRARARGWDRKFTTRKVRDGVRVWRVA